MSRIGKRVGYAATYANNDGGFYDLKQQNYLQTLNKWWGPIRDASGGTIVQPGNGYQYHVFTSSGSLNLLSGGNCDVLIVAGGGGGGSKYYSGGGGGGGVVYGTSVPLNGVINISVGAGGTAAVGPMSVAATPGTPSVFGGVVSIGGGRGSTPAPALPGGSGGGAGSGFESPVGFGTAVSAPVPVNYVVYGNPGGNYGANNGGGAGLGGGQIGYGKTISGFEGPLIAPAIPSPVRPAWNGTYGVGPTGMYGAGGGKGEYYYTPSATPQGVQGGGGAGGGGGGPYPPTIATPGINFTGGGGGGTNFGDNGTNGGSGIVIVRFEV